MEYTARDIDTNLKSGSRSKKAYVYSGYPNPVVPITANTFKTGKHGAGKTRMLLKDFFTDQSFSIILNSDQSFVDVESCASYTTQIGIITQINKEDLTLLNSNYEYLDVKCSDPSILEKLRVDSQVLYVCFNNGTQVKHKIKNLV